MIITKSNILLGLTPIVSTGLSGDLPQNLTDPDFSTLYVSADPYRLTVDFGATNSITYVAVAGINIAEGEKATSSELSRVRVYDGVTVIKTNQIIRNNCVVITFDSRVFSNLRVGLRNKSGLANPICTFIAAGEHLTVPNGGEQGGYNRQYLNRNTTKQITSNKIAAPTSILTKKKQAKGSLKVPNVTRYFSEYEWQDFLDFAETNYFFIQEQQYESFSVYSGVNSSAYLCYNTTKNNVSAHGQTRKLNNLSLSFDVYNGL